MIATSTARPGRTFMHLTGRFLRTSALALVLTALLCFASSVAAQARSAADAMTIDNYRLTMPVLREVLPALYAPGAQACPRPAGRDPHTLGIAEMVQSLERCVPVMQSLTRAGLPSRDAAIAFASLLRTGQQVALHGGKAAALPAGVLRDNAVLLEQNEPEITKLTRTGAPS